MGTPDLRRRHCQKMEEKREGNLPSSAVFITAAAGQIRRLRSELDAYRLTIPGIHDLFTN